MREPIFFEKYHIQVVQRAIQIMDVLLEARHSLSLEEISKRTQTPRSTAFRIITNLLEHNYLTETQDGYWLGLKMISFGAAVEDQLDLRRIALPHMQVLRDQSGETVYLAVLNADMQAIYVEKLQSEHLVGIVMANVGMTAYVHCTALGKVLIAEQPDEKLRAWLQTHRLIARTNQTITDVEVLLEELAVVRQRGYAVDHRENDEATCCVAAPVRNSRGEVIAAISVAGPEGRMPDPLIGSRIAELVVATAQRVSEAFGHDRRVPREQDNEKRRLMFRMSECEREQR